MQTGISNGKRSRWNPILFHMGKNKGEKGDRHMSETKTLKNPKQIAGFTHSKGIGKAIVFAIQNELDQAKVKIKMSI